MNDAEIRLECVKAAATTPGNPNHIQVAREYYAFVTERMTAQAIDEVAKTLADAHASSELKGGKGKTKAST